MSRGRRGSIVWKLLFVLWLGIMVGVWVWGIRHHQFHWVPVTRR